MKYSISINQLAGYEISKETGAPLDLIDLCIFECMVVFSGCNDCAKMQQHENIWYNIPHKIMINQLPLSPVKSGNAMYKRYKRLEEALLIKLNPNNAILNSVWLAWGDNYSRMFFKQDGTPLRKSIPPAKDQAPPLQESGGPLDEDQALSIIPIKGISINDSAGKKPAPKKPALIHRMVTAFEEEHQKYFLESGIWIGFNWGAANTIENGKEFGALKSLRTKLEKRVRNKKQQNAGDGAGAVEISEDEVLSAFVVFLQKAALDNWVLKNCFTPAQLNSQFNTIIQKITAKANGTTIAPKTGNSISDLRNAGVYGT